MFKKKPTMKQVVKNNHRDLEREKRTLSREVQNLERDEKKVTMEIKKLAAKGDMASARVLTKQLVRIRAQKQRLYKTQGQLTGIQHQSKAAATNVAVGQSMAKGARIMQGVNNMVPVQQTQRVAMAMQREQEKAEMKEEMMDDLFDDDEVDEEADAMLDGVFESIGLDLGSAMPSASTSTLSPQQQKARDDEVERMLAAI